MTPTSVNVPDDTEPEFISKENLAKLLDVYPSTIDDLAAHGYLPYYEIGKKVRFKLAEVRKRLDECRVEQPKTDTTFRAITETVRNQPFIKNLQQNKKALQTQERNGCTEQTKSPEANPETAPAVCVQAEPIPEKNASCHTEREFLDETELLKKLPISRRTLFQWRKEGKIPFICVSGRRVLFHWKSVKAALLRQTAY